MTEKFMGANRGMAGSQGARTMAVCALMALALLSGCITEEETARRPAQTPTLDTLPTIFPTTSPIPTITPFATYTNTPTIEPVPTRTPSATPSITPTPTVTWTPEPLVRLSSGQCIGQIIGGNLLVNGDFEAGQHEQDSVDIQVPDGWAAFWLPPGTPTGHDPDNTAGFQRPEMRVIANQPPYDNPPRIGQGSQAFLITGNERSFDAGILQKVSVQAGSTYCLTGIAHAWSNLHSDDPFHSTLEIPDDRRNANFLLGIDPQGGTDPYGGGVIWGQAAQIYDQYQPLLGVQTPVGSPTITVFVRGYMLWRFKHNEMFFDAISLVRVKP